MLTATHVSANTKPAVTHATTKAEPKESSGSEEVTIVKTVLKKRPPRDKYGPEGKLGKYEYDLISSPKWMVGLCHYTRSPHTTEENQYKHTRISEAYSWSSPSI